MSNMNIGDWFTLGAVIVALFFGVWSIIQTNLIQKKQYRHSLLMELTEWCTQLIEAVRLEEMPIIGYQDLEVAGKRTFGNKIFKLLALDGKSEYMYHISSISPILKPKVHQLRSKLDEISDLTFGQMGKGEIDFDKISGTSFRELEHIATDIIISTTQILTKNLY